MRIQIFVIVSILMCSCSLKHNEHEISFYNRILQETMDQSFALLSMAQKNVKDKGERVDEVSIFNKMKGLFDWFNEEVNKGNLREIKTELIQKLDTTIVQEKMLVRELEYLDKQYESKDTIATLKYSIGLYSGLNLVLLRQVSVIGAVCLWFDNRGILTYNRELKNDTLRLCILPTADYIKYKDDNSYVSDRIINITDLTTKKSLEIKVQEIGYSTIVETIVERNKDYLLEGNLIIKYHSMINHIETLYLKDTILCSPVFRSDTVRDKLSVNKK